MKVITTRVVREAGVNYKIGESFDTDLDRAKRLIGLGMVIAAPVYAEAPQSASSEPTAATETLDDATEPVEKKRQEKKNNKSVRNLQNK